MMPDYEVHFMEFLWYDLHLNTERLKVKKFLFNLNFNMHEKVRILMPKTFHDVI